MKNLIIITIILGFVSCGKKTEETKPIRKDVTETVFASGILEAKGTYYLTAQVEGYLVNINFEEGDLVEEGKILAVIDNKESGFNTQSANELYKLAQSNTQANAPALAQAKTSIDIAKQKMDQDALQEQRYKKLLESNSIARVEYENISLGYQTSKSNYEAALENYKRIQRDAEQQLINNKASRDVNTVVLGKNQIKAVVAGKIYKKNKQVGDFVRKGDIIATIGDAQNIYAKINIDESNISRIKIGQEAVIQLNTQKNKNYMGVVTEIYPSFDETSQSFIAKIAFKDSLDFKIINTQLQTNIMVGFQKNALLIPRNYIDFGGRVQIKGQKEKIKVKTHIVSSDWVQVLGGIDENTILITENIASNQIKTSEAGSSLMK
ncbi:MAG: efflux RND transporter periplasmic adaptor subunit [Raineya sp.]|jgi:multidrug efflux pump subunit AcrA (membrane-fusion protein)|nr:efflux RND transporter periplasmic adaptor subunit [Raineya sp.]